MNKSHLSVRIDDILLRHVRTKPNYSRYIESLIKQDMQLQTQEPIYQAIMQRLLDDVELLPKLARKLHEAGVRPTVEKVDGVQYISGDFGA